MTLESLAGYRSVILENVSVEKLSNKNLANLTALVEKTGLGLVVTGGKSSYGQGGYYKSELEKILPVSMEMKKDVQKLNAAVVAVLDRSGSMGISVGNGKTKMDLANLACVEVVNTPESER